MSDPGLRACGYAARGLWKDLLCIAGSNKKEYGFVSLNGRKLSDSDIARMTNGTESEVTELLEELEKNGVFSRDRRGIIYCRRMIRAEKNRTNGRLGGNPKLLNKQENKEPVKTKPKALIPEPEPEPNPDSKKVRAAARQNRGCRIDPEWKPSDADKNFAKQEGFNDFEIHQEANKFKDYWMACAGAKGIKLDWPATWRQWIRRAAEQAGKRPRQNPSDTVSTKGFYAESDSEQLDAWDLHTIKTTGKGLPRDRNFGWRVPSEWPPGYGELSLKNEDENAA
jgi:hypothetical protein